VTITDTQTGNSCWGNITVEDKLAPQIEVCPCEEGNDDPDCRFLCSDLDAILNGDIDIPFPTVHENCSSYTYNPTNTVIDNGCGGKVLKRSYIFTDAYGNKSQTCESYIYFDAVELADITPPTPLVQLTCGAKTSPQEIFNYFKPLIGEANARKNAWPTINGQIITQSGPCTLAAAKTDSEVLACGSACPDNKKIIRTWTVLDWCSGDVGTYIQIIKATDVKAPTIIAKDLTVSTDPWACTANIQFPDPTTLQDNCSGAVTYKVEGPLGVQVVYQSNIQKWVALDVPKGTYNFYYKGYDCCENVGIDTVSVTVADLMSPVAISKEFIVVSLTNSGDGKGTAKIYPQSIDNGSHDACSPVKLEIRRDEDKCNVSGNDTYNDDGHPFDGSSNPNHPDYDPDKGNYVKFCCADLTGVENGVAFGIVKVWMRVWDDGDMDGKYGTAGDNYNETWTHVRVEDKLPPQLVCPPNITLECYQNVTDLNITGTAKAYNTCGEAEVAYTDDGSVNSCGNGTVRRRWYVKSTPSIFCIQSIYVKPAPTYTVNITWPQDVTTDCKHLPLDPKPIYSGGPCNLLGHSLESDTFYVEDGACMKILNKFTVIDWCTYDINGTSNVGKWTHTQIIKVIDEEAPVITCTDKMFEVNDNGDADNDGNKCELKSLTLTKSADDNGDCASKWLKWIVLVDLYGDGVTDYEYSSFLPTGDANLNNDTNLNGIKDKYLQPSGSGQEISITIPDDINGSMNNHKVLWKVFDGCGNNSSCLENIMVVDKKKPTPYCLSLSTALMINGTVELWARDFDKGSFDNCTRSQDLRFTFDQSSPVTSKLLIEHYFKGNGVEATKAEFDAGNAQRWVPASRSSSKIFNCDDLPEVDVEMTVWDEKFNFDYCTVKLTLVDNQGACGGTNATSIAGQITVDTKGLNKAKVHLSGAGNTITKEVASNSEGRYNFNFNPMYIDYEVTASKNDDVLNGISTIDLVMIQRHILSVSKFNKAEQIIAADVNNDSKVTTSDLVELRKVILGVKPTFDNNQSWRFLDKNTSIANPQSPWPLDEKITILQLSSPMNDQNFNAIKIGDVNGNALTSFIHTDSENRSGKTSTLFVEEQEVTVGNIYKINLNVKEQDVLGIQSAIKTFGLDILSLEFDNSHEESYYHVKSKDLALLSWTGLDGKSSLKNIVLTVKATKSGLLSNMISFDNNILPSSAIVGESLEEQPLQIIFRTLQSDVVKEFILYQNEPNPFKEVTTINFQLPQAQEAQLSIFDVNGKLLYSDKKKFNKGKNAFTVNMQNIGYVGVMYYKIESGEYSATKAMINLK
jgi:5-hydroxyisourate hydrolase-like protein (transthyretin family)